MVLNTEVIDLIADARQRAMIELEEIRKRIPKDDHAAGARHSISLAQLAIKNRRISPNSITAAQEILAKK